MAQHSVSVEGTLNAYCYRQFPPVVNRGDVIHLDLSGVRFCAPDGLVAISSYIERSVKSNVTPLVILPKDTNARIYMSRMRFGGILDESGIEHDLLQVNERAPRGRFIELTRFSSEAEVLTLARHVHDRLEVVSGSEAAEKAFLAISELGSNVPQHAGVGCGILMAQQFLRANRFDFVIADYGIGLYASLAAHQPAGHDHAIEMAVTRGISSINEPGRGEGLADIRHKICDAGGTLTLISGAGEGAFSTERGGIVRAGVGYFPGTLILGSVPLSK